MENKFWGCWPDDMGPEKWSLCIFVSPYDKRRSQSKPPSKQEASCCSIKWTSFKWADENVEEIPLCFRSPVKSFVNRVWKKSNYNTKVWIYQYREKPDAIGDWLRMGVRVRRNRTYWVRPNVPFIMNEAVLMRPSCCVAPISGNKIRISLDLHCTRFYCSWKLRSLGAFKQLNILKKIICWKEEFQLYVVDTAAYHNGLTHHSMLKNGQQKTQTTFLCLFWQTH